MASVGGYELAFSKLGGFQGVVVGALWSRRRRGDVRDVFLSGRRVLFVSQGLQTGYFHHGQHSKTSLGRPIH